MNPFFIQATTISDCWFQLIRNIFDYGYFQKIQSGSFENEQTRIQYPCVGGSIEHPDKDIVPIIPTHLNLPSPTTMEYIEDYFANYLMNPELGENETYKYSSRIHHPMPKGGTQFDRIVDILKNTPLTNQAVIEIGSPEDMDVCIGNDGKIDPPCLRLLDFKVIPIQDTLKLTVSVYFRSWDLWSAFPSNLGGIELLKQYIASETNLENGQMYFYSSGLHIYGYQEEFARIRTYR